MYKIFSKYVLRTPIFPINYYFNLTKDQTITDKKLLQEFENPVIKEAIYLASPILFKEIEKWSEKKIKEAKEINKIRISFLKYLSRLSSRATPFGLFSGSCLGKISDVDFIKIHKSHNRNTRLDMNLTGLLIKKLERDIEIKNNLLFYPNTSIYTCGYQLRYVESNYNKELLTYQIVEIDNSEYLTEIFNSCKNGLTILDISNVIVDSDISLEEATNFVHDLIENQVLISELQQTVSGEENINQILNTLNRINPNSNQGEKLELIRRKLSKLDNKIGNQIKDYNEISNLLNSFDISIDEKYVFQTDLILKTKSNFLNDNIASKLLDSLQILNKVTIYSENKNLEDFKKLFLERYENREMPLSLVLDNEIGIGYPIKSINDVNSLIDDLVFINNNDSSTKKVDWSILQSILLKKITLAIKNNQSVVEIIDSELNDLTANWDDLPDTFSTIIQIVNIDNVEKIIMTAVGGSSATNLLGRFCHCDYEINEFVNEICEFEEVRNKNKIIAEIIHLPEDRLGNVLMRPSFRNFEIPYLSKSLKEKENQIELDDITISIWENRIILKSKKEDKELIPRLSTAHNYSTSSLPVYRFLCDMQINEKRNYIGFDLGVLGNEFSFLPRITYKDIIFSTAKWQIYSNEIKNFITIKNKKALLKSVKIWAKTKKIPQYVYLIEGDNKLLINLLNISSIDMFISIISNKEKVLIEEFLYNNQSISKNQQKEHYVNEFIISFYNNKVKTI